MRLYTTERREGTLPIGALLMIPLFALPMGAWLVEQQVIDLGICGLRQAIDIPCLSCGATRATMALLGGDLISAISLQPLIVTLYVLISVWGIASFATFMRNRKLVLDLSRIEDLLFKGSLIVLPLLNWAYLIWQDV